MAANRRWTRSSVTAPPSFLNGLTLAWWCGPASGIQGLPQPAFAGPAHSGDKRASTVEIREWESGRIEARTGLRMMPTFRRSPLSFRTAGFPQYGWKVGFPSGAFLDRRQLKPAPGMRCLSSSLHPPFVHLGVNVVDPDFDSVLT